MKEQIVLPNILMNPVYVKGLDQPLLTLADRLDKQGHPETAIALRNANSICQTFASIHLDKTHVLFDSEKESHLTEDQYFELFGCARSYNFESFMELIGKYRITYF